MKLRAVMGLFGMIGQRARDLGQPGLSVYADAGVRATVAVVEPISSAAHAIEVNALEQSRLLEAILADGRVDPAEIKDLARMPAGLQRLSARAHDIGETVKL